jgi:hypothetical protein
MSQSWRGTRMLHLDGREGVIASDYTGFLHRALTIEVAGQEATESIQLNATTTDSGALGWQWMSARDGEPERWTLLGDHNPREEPVETSS